MMANRTSQRLWASRHLHYWLIGIICCFAITVIIAYSRRLPVFQRDVVNLTSDSNNRVVAEGIIDELRIRGEIRSELDVDCEDALLRFAFYANSISGSSVFHAETVVHDNQWSVSLPRAFCDAPTTSVGSRIESLCCRGTFVMVNYVGHGPGELVAIGVDQTQQLECHQLPGSTLMVTADDDTPLFDTFRIADATRAAGQFTIANPIHPGIRENILLVAEGIKNVWDTRRYPFKLDGADQQAIWVGAETKTWERVLIDWKKGGIWNVELRQSGSLQVNVPQFPSSAGPYLLITNCDTHDVVLLQPIPSDARSVHVDGLRGGCYGVGGYLIVAHPFYFPKDGPPMQVYLRGGDSVEVTLNWEQFQRSDR